MGYLGFDKHKKDELEKKWKSKESHVEIPAKCGEVS